MPLFFFFYHGSTALVDQGFLFVDDSWSHWDTPHSVGLLDERSARHRDLYLTTHNTHKRQTPMPRRHSKPQSQLAIGCRPMPWTVRPLRSVQCHYSHHKSQTDWPAIALGSPWREASCYGTGPSVNNNNAHVRNYGGGVALSPAAFGREMARDLYILTQHTICVNVVFL